MLVTVDTLRADHLGCYGYFRSTSPFLDRLAERSVVFTRAMAASSHTAPSHASIFTGLPPALHGLETNGGRLAPDVHTAAEMFRAAGYETAAFISVEFLAGVADGFEHVRAKTSMAGAIAKAAITWLRRTRRSERFLLWLHFYDPHRWKVPERIPTEHLRALREATTDTDAAYAAVARLHGIPEAAPGEPFEPLEWRSGDRGAEQIRPQSRREVLEYIDVYDAQIALMDAELERVHRALEQLELGPTLWIVTWELAYHSRWVAPDGVLVTFAAFALLGTTLACLEPKRRMALVGGALAAGAACGTKWPAGLLLLPVLLAAWFGVERATRRTQLLALLGMGGWFSLAYLVSTPGTFLDADTVLEALQVQQGRYGSGHLGHTVGRGADHLFRVLEYFSLVFFSRFPLVSLVFLGASLVGVASLVRESGRLALVFGSFPVAYLLFFSAYPVMIPRNYLVLAPFLAVLAARGIVVLVQQLPRGAPRRVALAGVGALLLLDAAWLVHAGESIRVGDKAVFVRELASYLDDHPDTRYAASETILRHLRQLDGTPRPHVVPRPLEEADEVVFYASEAYGHLVGMRTRHDLTRATFGPLDVNLNYYPSWLGEDRIVVLPAAHYPRRPLLSSEDAPPMLRPGFAR